MIQIDETKLNTVVETALETVTGNKRWTNAILRGHKLLTSDNPYLHFDGTRLLVLSDSGAIYEANGVCQCAAYKEGFACRHRAAYKILKNYTETV